MGSQAPRGIGSLTEKSLHRRLKELYSGKRGARTEVKVGNYIVDVWMRDKIIEIQTGNFSTIKQKLQFLLKDHKVRLVYPLIHKKTLIYCDEQGAEIRRSRSSKRQTFAHATRQLYCLAELLGDPHLEIELLLTELEEDRIKVPLPPGKSLSRYTREFRRGDCRLLNITQAQLYQTREDYRSFLPPELPQTFTIQDAAPLVLGGLRQARLIFGFLKKLNLIQPAGKEGRAVVYRRTANPRKSK
jgi:hypothetical protein